MSGKIAFAPLQRRLNAMTAKQMELAEDYFDEFMQRVYPMHEIHRCADDIRETFMDIVAKIIEESASKIEQQKDRSYSVHIALFSSIKTSPGQDPITEITLENHAPFFIDKQGAMGFGYLLSEQVCHPFGLGNQQFLGDGVTTFYNHPVFRQSKKHQGTFVDKSKRAFGISLNHHSFSFTELGIEPIEDSILEKIYDLEVKKQRLILYALKPILNKHAVQAMKVAQIYSPVFYNWLCGWNETPKYFAERYKIYPEQAAIRQQTVFIEPFKGHFIGFLLSQDKLEDKIQRLKSLNSRVPDLHLKFNHDPEDIWIAAVDKLELLTPQISSPRFWINYIDTLQSIIKHQEFQKLGKDPRIQAHLSKVHTMALTLRRQMDSRPKCVPGGML